VSDEGVVRGVYRYRSGKAFSADPGDYGAGRLVTDDSEPGKLVIDLAISPDEKRMAVVANYDSSRFEVYLTTPGDFELAKAKRLPIQACTVAWRPDSLELAIVKADNCSGPGEIARVEIADPRESFTLAPNGDAPVYSPVAPDAGAAG
jgi:hypothetical protein